MHKQLFYSVRFDNNCWYVIRRRILGKKKVAELLIQNGIDVNHMDNNNQTALHRAASQGNFCWSFYVLQLNIVTHSLIDLSQVKSELPICWSSMVPWQTSLITTDKRP